MTPSPSPEPQPPEPPSPSPPPIACSLDAGSLAERAAAWRALVASSVTAVETEAGKTEAGETAVRLVLRDTDVALTAAVALAQREKECCPFFDVSLALEPDRRTLILAVPDGAEEALAGFVAMLTG
jgi:hypothetical protein